MGCSPSKLRADDTVRRCKDRRRFINDAVNARHHLAAAHSDYCRSLRLTASALIAFASGEPLSVSDHSPTVLRRPPSSPSPSASPSIFHPPPPPPPPRSPLSTASSNRRRNPPPPRQNNIKLPHILSDSSLPTSPAPINFDYVPKAHSTYSNTPSQASSIWDWDHFYPPPSPPDSDYFHKIPKSETLTSNSNPSYHHQHTDDDDDDDDDDDLHNARDHSSHLQNHIQFDDVATNHSSRSRRRNSQHWETDEESETKRDEVHCSEWGDHDSFSSSSSRSSTNDDDDEAGEFTSRSDYRATSKSNHAEDSSAPVNLNPQFSTKSSSGWGDRKDDPASADRRLVPRHQNFVEIAASLREHFDKAVAAGNQVSEMLETGRAQLNQSFKQLRKTIVHSTGIFSNLASTWTSKPPLTVKYRLELNSIEQYGGMKGLCSTLDRLLAWEKKLYQEVKAREGVKLAHEKKLSMLQCLEYRGEEGAKLDKTKASIKRLQSVISVTSQAASTTSSAIIGLRNSDLIPQLVELCHGFMYMWRAMNKSHEIQSNVVQQVRGLVTTKGTLSTSDVHRQATRDLESAISTWHSSFHHVIKFHRDFVRAIQGWFKLTLLPVDTEPRNKNRDSSHILAFFDEWRLALDRVPDTVASEAIKSFDNVVHSIFTKQSEELKMKKRADAVSRELEKKTAALQTLEKKYYGSYSLVGVALPDDNDKDSGHLLDTRDPLMEKRAELAMWKRRVDDEMAKHAKAVEVTRAMTLHNIQMGLPGVFDAMTGFSTLMTESLEIVCTRSYAIQ